MDKNSQAFLLFQLSESFYAIELASIHEIILLPELKKYPDMSLSKAFLNFHETIIPVVDLYRSLRLSNGLYSINDYVVIIEVDHSLFGLIVPGTLDIVALNFTAPNELHIQSEHHLFTNVGTHAGQVVFVLDPKLILQLIHQIPDGRPEFLTTDQTFSQEEKKILSSRALELSRPLAITQPQELTHLLVVRINKEYFGINPGLIKELSFLTDLTALPASIPHVLGLIKMRGLIVSLIDIWKFLGVQASELKNASTAKVIILNMEEFNVGVVVDEIFDIVAFPKEDFIPNPLGVKEGDYIKHTIHYQNSILGVLDIKEIMRAMMSLSH